jgi:acetylornithine deacetylase/succinyl-diaminopimelate desuccinylase-like protein
MLQPAAVLDGISTRDIVELTSRLVSVPSIGEEAAVMDEARRYLEEQGLAVEVRSRDPQRPNLVITIGTGSPVLILNGHLDTVPVAAPEAWQTEPLTPTVVGDRLYGLGAFDMKGPCAVMMLAAARLSRYSDHLRGSLQLQLVSDEESGCFYGTIFLIEEILAGRLARPQMVISGEPSWLKLMNAERGSFKYTVTFYGRPSHTVMARTEGINPIAHAARAVLALEQPLPRFHPEVGYGVISVNEIQAGGFPSAVPGECSLLIDRRMLPGETDESCLAETEEIVREVLRDAPEARFEVRRWSERRYSPPNLTDWTSPVVQAVARAHETVTGSRAEPFLDYFGATDGRLFRYEGIDTVAYGPRGAHPHGSNEYVEVSSLYTQLQVLVTAAIGVLSD